MLAKTMAPFPSSTGRCVAVITAASALDLQRTEERDFGKIPDGTTVKLFTLRNAQGMLARIGTRVNVRRLRPTAADTNDMSMLPQTQDATEIAAQTLELPPTPIRLLLVDGHAETLGSGR